MQHEPGRKPQQHDRANAVLSVELMGGTGLSCPGWLCFWRGVNTLEKVVKDVSFDLADVHCF